MAHPLAFSRGAARKGLAHPGTNAFAAKLPQTWSLVCDAERNNKKKAPRGIEALSQIVLVVLGLLPLFGRLLVNLLHFLRHMISFYRLLL